MTQPNSQPVPPVHELTSNSTLPQPPVHAEDRLDGINRIDAFTDFINEWIDTNVKVFTRKEKTP